MSGAANDTRRLIFAVAWVASFFHASQFAIAQHTQTYNSYRYASSQWRQSELPLAKLRKRFEDFTSRRSVEVVVAEAERLFQKKPVTYGHEYALALLAARETDISWCSYHANGLRTFLRDDKDRESAEYARMRYLHDNAEGLGPKILDNLGKRLLLRFPKDRLLIYSYTASQDFRSEDLPMRLKNLRLAETLIKDHPQWNGTYHRLGDAYASMYNLTRKEEYRVKALDAMKRFVAMPAAFKGEVNYYKERIKRLETRRGTG